MTFLTPPLERETEITGPLAAKLYVSSEAVDADLFLVVRLFTPNMSEVTFQGALDPHTPIAQGWLRASHRKLDPKLTQPYRPYHTHDEKQPLTPGHVYELDVEIWPTSIVAPAGYRLGLTVRGRDYEYPGGPSVGLGTLGAVFTGVGPFQHNDPRDRPPDVFVTALAPAAADHPCPLSLRAGLLRALLGGRVGRDEAAVARRVALARERAPGQDAVREAQRQEVTRRLADRHRTPEGDRIVHGPHGGVLVDPGFLTVGAGHGRLRPAQHCLDLTPCRPVDGESPAGAGVEPFTVLPRADAGAQCQGRQANQDHP